MIEAQQYRRQPPDLDFMGQIGRAEYTGSETHERGQNDQKYIEVIDDDEIAARMFGEKQRGRSGKREGASKDVDDGAEPIAGDQRENRDRGRRADEDGFHRDDHATSLRPPRNRSSARTTTVCER